MPFFFLHLFLLYYILKVSSVTNQRGVDKKSFFGDAYNASRLQEVTTCFFRTFSGSFFLCVFLPTFVIFPHTLVIPAKALLLYSSLRGNNKGVNNIKKTPAFAGVFLFLETIADCCHNRHTSSV